MFGQDHSDIRDWVVLIVDDEPDNIGVPEGLLSYYGVSVHTASNGFEGLDQFAKITPTVILLDLSMPKMDGWEMLRRLRAEPRGAQQVVIALTAHAMRGDAERVLDAGFDGYIAKPIDIMTFIGEIKATLDARQRHTATTGAEL